MKFKLGEIVRHKISKKKYVVTNLLPASRFRKYQGYRVDDGEDEEGLIMYESELELSGRRKK